MREDITLATNDPAYGVENCATPGDIGLIPWKTLGLTEGDAWVEKRTAANTPYLGYFRYRIDSAFKVASITSATNPADGLSVVDNNGVAQTQATNPPVFIIWSTGPNRTADSRNADADNTQFEAGDQAAAYDDLVIWVSRLTLLGRLSAAGAL